MHISYIELSLTDGDGNNINLGKKINWEIVLNIQVVKDPLYNYTEAQNINGNIELSQMPTNRLEKLKNEFIDVDEINKKHYA